MTVRQVVRDFARRPRLVALAAVTGVSAVFGRNYGLTLAVLVTGPLAGGSGSVGTVTTGLAFAGILGAVLGAPAATGRVLGVTQIVPRSSTVRVRGIASSGRMAYSPYGVGMYGSLGAAYAPDLSFKCDVDYRGYIRDIDIMRR
jgi:hypothetical protein